MKYNVPIRKFIGAERKMVSFRVPESLLKQIDSFGKKSGWEKTDVMLTVLDQFLQSGKPVPKLTRDYSDDARITLSTRFPILLSDKLKAAGQGANFTDVVISVLTDFINSERKANS